MYLKKPDIAETQVRKKNIGFLSTKIKKSMLRVLPLGAQNQGF